MKRFLDDSHRLRPHAVKIQQLALAELRDLVEAVIPMVSSACSAGRETPSILAGMMFL